MTINRAVTYSGGGANILFLAGVAKYFKENNIKFDAAYGVSSGALTAVMEGLGKTDRLLEIVQTVKDRDVFKKGFLPWTVLKMLLFKRLYLYNNEPLWELLKREAIGTYKMPVEVGVVDVSDTGRFSVHSNDEPGFKKYALASTAIPFVFPPVAMNGRMLVDGGLLHVNPLGHLIKNYDPNEIIIVNTYRSELRDLQLKYPRNLIDYAGTMIRIIMAQSMNDDIHQFLHINELVKQAAEQGAKIYSPSGREYKYFKYRLIEAEKYTGNSIDFTNADRRLIDHGYEQAQGAYWGRSSYTFTTTGSGDPLYVAQMEYPGAYEGAETSEEPVSRAHEKTSANFKKLKQKIEIEAINKVAVKKPARKPKGTRKGK